MKSSVYLLMLLLTGSSLLAQKSVIGTWKGRITPQLRIVFHFDRSAGGALYGTLDSPDQGVNGMDLSAVRQDGDSLVAEVQVAHARYAAVFTSDSTLSGFWIQGPAKLAVVLTRESNLSGVVIPRRPQTPGPPLDYLSQDVEYDNPDHSVHYGATLTYPRSGRAFASAVLITGSGLQDRDETIFYHKPFAVIADYLTRQGFAILRVDDRSIGKSTGDVSRATSADFAGDVLASIAYLKTRKELDSLKIGLIGHSEGGLIAPIVAARYPPVKFIISLAGTGISGADILLRQQTDPLKGQGISQAAFEAYYELTRYTLFYIHDHAAEPDSLVLGRLGNYFDGWKSSLPDSILNQLHVKEVGAAQYTRQIAAELQPWLKYFISTDPATFWQQVHCPVLALNGSRDIQVYPAENIAAIARALQRGGNHRVTTMIFPGLNHLFQHCKQCSVEEYKELEETFSPEVLAYMAAWMKKNIK